MNPLHANLDLMRDLEDRLNTADLLEWVENQADTLSKDGVSAGGHIEFNRNIQRQRKIRAICVANIVGKACIRPADRGEYTILYARQLEHDEKRRRFAIAHELGHTYWFAPGGKARPLSPVQSKSGADPGIEYLCDRFAAAFLLPRQSLSAFFQTSGETSDLPLRSITTASGHFKVPEKVVARRLLYELATERVAIIALRRRETDSDKVHESRWHIYWTLFPQELYEFPRSDLKTPVTSTKRRAVPLQMIPDAILGSVVTTAIDGRWWDLLQTLPAKLAGKPFDRFPHKPSRSGLVYRQDDTIYIALPLESQ